MKKLIVSLPVLLCGVLVVLLFSAQQMAGEVLQKDSPDSVKGLKLKVSPNGRYFVDQHGKPFFYLGDTAWLLFQRFDPQEADEYLKDRAAKGFTVRSEERRVGKECRSRWSAAHARRTGEA